VPSQRIHRQKARGKFAPTKVGNRYEHQQFISQPRTGQNMLRPVPAPLSLRVFCLQQLFTWPGLACFRSSSPVRRRNEETEHLGAFGLVAGSVLFRPARHLAASTSSSIASMAPESGPAEALLLDDHRRPRTLAAAIASKTHLQHLAADVLSLMAGSCRQLLADPATARIPGLPLRSDGLQAQGLREKAARRYASAGRPLKNTGVFSAACPI